MSVGDGCGERERERGGERETTSWQMQRNGKTEKRPQVAVVQYGIVRRNQDRFLLYLEDPSKATLTVFVVQLWLHPRRIGFPPPKNEPPSHRKAPHNMNPGGNSKFLTDDHFPRHKAPFIHPFPSFSAIMSTSEPPSKRIMLVWRDDPSPAAPTVAPTVAELLHRLEAAPYIKTDLDNAESLVAAVPTIAAPPNSPETVPYIFTTEYDAQNPACTEDGGTSVWSMYGQYFDVPNDPKEMFLFFRSLFDDVYRTVAAGAFLSIRQLALLHGAPFLLGIPGKRKASAIVEQENRVQPRVENSARQPAGPPSIRQPAGLRSAHQPAGLSSARQPARPQSARQPTGLSSARQPARPPSYRQPARPSSAHQPAGPPSACETAGPPPSPSQPAGPSYAHQPAGPSSACEPAGPPSSVSQPAGPSFAFALANGDRGGAKRTRPAPSVPFRRIDRYQLIPPSLDLGDFTGVADACSTLGICDKVIKGKYLEGLITFDGRYSNTKQSIPKCETCAKYNKRCNLLVGGWDRYVKVSACGACTQRGLTCSLKHQIHASYRQF